MNRDSGRPVWKVRSAAIWHGRKTAGELYEARRMEPVKAPTPEPPGWDQADDKDHERSRVSAQVPEWWQAIKKEFRKLNDEQRFPIFVERYREPVEAAGLKCNSLSTLYRYLRRGNPKSAAYDGNPDGRRQRGPGTAELPGSEEFRGELLYAWLGRYRAAKNTLKPAWKIACGLALKRGEKPPGYSLVLRWVNREIPESVRDFYRNEQRWLRECVESVRRDKSQFRPGEWWSGDWHRCDFLAVHNGKPIRPWLCIWQDMATGMVVSWALAVRPNSEELIMSYGEGVIAWGAPLHLLIDNGLDFKAKGFTGGKPKSKDDSARLASKRLTDEQAARLRCVLAETGTTPHFCWLFNPGSKPPESWFKTFCLLVSMLFETHVGNKPDNRPEHLYADLRANRIDVPTLEEARAVVGDFIENVYNEEGKDGLGGRSPIEAFAQDDPIPKRTAPEHVVRHKLMARTVVTVGRGGTVILNGIKYGAGRIRDDSTLFDLQKQGIRVQVRYDSDRCRVFVHGLDGKLICEARDDRLRGVDSTDVRELRERQKAARKRCRQAGADAKIAHRNVSVAAMIRAQERFVQEQNKGRKAVGAELLSSRPLALLPGSAELDKYLSPPRSSVGGRKDVATPLDALPMPEHAAPGLVNPLDEAPLPDAPDDEGWGHALDDLPMPEEPSGRDADCPVDDTPVPEGGDVGHSEDDTPVFEGQEVAAEGSPLDRVESPLAETDDDAGNPLDALPDVEARPEEWVNPLDQAGES